MFFTVQLNKNNTKLDECRLILKARSYIALYQKNVNEIMLDSYLIDKYGKSLKVMCLNLLNNVKISHGYKNEAIIIFNTHKLDKIATLITYGNGKIQGSDILKKCFL